MQITMDVPDILERHFQEMIRRTKDVTHSTPAWSWFDNDAIPADVLPLIYVAEDLHGVILPVRPSLRFRRELHQALLLQYRQRAAQQTLFPMPTRDEMPTWWWRAAATAPVVVGILAYLWHRYNRTTEDSPMEASA